jgi:glycosyltransferase involved in cell wall biosynthesis
MRVLILHSRYLSGAASGENRVAEDEARLLRDAGHHVAVWAPEPAVGGAGGMVKAGLSTVWSPSAVARVRKRIRSSNAEIVHVHNLFPMISPAVLRAADEEGAAVLVTLHNYRLLCLPATFLREGKICEACLGRVPWRGVRFRCYRDSLPGSAALAASITLHRSIRTFSHVRRFLAVSEFVRSKYVEAGFAPGQIVVKPNFTVDAERRRGPGDYFLYLGRLSPEKGVETVVRGWRAELGRLLVVGDGPSADAVRSLAPEGVEFRGAVESTAVPAILSRARALLVPSRWYEAAPRSITEAYAAGVPVLASRIGALEEAVEDGASGLLVSLDDEERWYDAMKRLSDDEESERLGAGARALWSARFSPERGLEALEAVYREAASARSG